jgi:hypothetical protein
MPYNCSQALRVSHEYMSPAIEARRLRIEYNRLQRRLIKLDEHPGTETEANKLRDRVDHIARNLGAIRANSVHAVESKLKVAVDKIDKTTQRLLASALTDLHYLALLTAPPTQ